eukprot:CAMPEP_0194767052 /NCGR_PEP_ID=MMETSP0323_2-20130528/34306_1 /TAXON_ID=2866 ORGANISM="Crypthecodinium cohnii, Strain Seligo" /NCGR_SAMPLE_ID=MMETSP0323_2 /ASSEMBLY_ACC=CAM_ASM_000346 /LENGTH=44 /DNA_ID= /DNA_START= /DNA_END= /DNA_ORIENTATION=
MSSSLARVHSTLQFVKMSSSGTLAEIGAAPAIPYWVPPKKQQWT